MSANAPPKNRWPELDREGWQSFERGVDAALLIPAKHRGAKPKGESSPAKARAKAK